jgi:hypothetical protein
MTVAELISVLEELNPSDPVVIGHPLLPHSADMEYSKAADSVYPAIVTVDDHTFNAVVIDMEG